MLRRDVDPTLRAPWTLGIVILVLVGHPVAAEVPAVGRGARTSLAVTVYERDLGLVTDTRDVPLAMGESVVHFQDVAAKIDPRSVGVYSISNPAGLAVVEQSFLFDLVSPDALLEKYVGREVELVETDARLRRRTTKAVLLSTQGGPVYRLGDRIALGHPGRVVLPADDGALNTRPTLVWRLTNTGPARHRIEVSYLTAGLAWATDYVVVANADTSKADLTGWVTVTNRSGARYDDATLKLVAGQLNRTQAPSEPVFAAGERMAAVAPPRFVEEDLFEYHVYALDRRATLPENESKQMRLLAAQGIPLTRSFVLVGQPAWFRSRQGDLGRDLPVGVFLELENDEAHRLGVPLPAGTVRLYQQDKAGSAQFVGEDTIRHVPKDEKVTVKAGNAFDVVASRTQNDYRTLTAEPWDAEVAFTITLRNHKREPVKVSVREPVGGEWKVIESSHPAVKIDARTLGFEALVPADGAAVVRYRIQIAY
jgi:hypothetical protein